MKNLLSLLLLIFIANIYLGCHTTEPLDTLRLSLSIVDVSVKEAYLKVHVNSPNPGETVELQRNGKAIMVFPSRSDTLIADTVLNENTTYSYKLILKQGGLKASVSNDLSLTTLSPSNHTFTWREFRFGNVPNLPSQFTDVLVLGDNDIWACGEIYFKDSLNGYHDDCYGAAHWDGNNWKFYKIMMHSYPTAPKTTHPVFSLTMVNNNLYGLSYAGIVNWVKGYGWYETTQFIKMGQENYYDQMKKMWAKDESLIYCVGSSGAVYIADGKENTAKKIRGGAEPNETHVLDAWGVTDPITEKLTVYCALNNEWSYKGRILKITDIDKTAEIPVEFAIGVSTVWTNKGFPVYFGGGRSFYENSCGKWKEINLGGDVFLSRIRGNALNDFFAVGSSNVLAHYNGRDWKMIPEFNNSVYFSVHMKNNTVAVAGWSGYTGTILIGTR